jgi:hypothetical protein
MNYVAILVCAVINVAVGSLWYSPVLFAKPWIKAMGFTKKEMDKSMKEMQWQMYLMPFLIAIITAVILSWFIGMLGVQTAAEGFETGFLAWFGFVATTMFTNWMFSHKPKELYLINVSYPLVIFCISGIILAVWK